LDDLKEARDKSSLPDEPDEESIEQLLMEIVVGYYNFNLNIK